MTRTTIGHIALAISLMLFIPSAMVASLPNDSDVRSGGPLQSLTLTNVSGNVIEADVFLEKGNPYHIALLASSYSAPAGFASLGYRLILTDKHGKVIMDAALRSARWEKTVTVGHSGAYQLSLAPLVPAHAVFDVAITKEQRKQ